VCGGHLGGGVNTSDVWWLDLGRLQWEPLPSLTRVRLHHACCAVRGGVVALGGVVSSASEPGHENTASVETLRYDSKAEENMVTVLPPLSCGPVGGPVAVGIDESESDQGELLLIGGWGESESEVRKVDLATGVCTAQPSLLSSPRGRPFKACTAGRLPDGRIVCAGSTFIMPDEEQEEEQTAQVLEPPPHGTPGDAMWRWRALPGMSVGRSGGRGCFLSDGRFAVFGGADEHYTRLSSCEALTLDANGEHWAMLPPMHEARLDSACAAIGGCVIIAGGQGSVTAEVYEEGLGQWRRLPCRFAYDTQLRSMGSALMCATVRGV
jgi:hypothetical protein